MTYKNLNYLKQLLKNSFGWKTNRKVIVFSVDDYGVVRVSSKAALQAALESGVRPDNRFDRLDALENRDDIEGMMETLGSVKDSKNRSAVMSAFLTPMNLDYEKFQTPKAIPLEPLDVTFQKLQETDPSAYTGAWSAWKMAVKRGLFYPAFHGCQHWNSSAFREFSSRDPDLFDFVLKQRSYAWVPESVESTIRPMQGCAANSPEQLEEVRHELSMGIDAFTNLFGRAPVYFNAPGGNEPLSLHAWLASKGLRFIDVPRAMKRMNPGVFKTKRFFYTGAKGDSGQTYIVRNVVFEPTSEQGRASVDQALSQIDAAFKMRRAAVISSHRVNFAGHIEKQNRETGLASLKELLERIVSKWPDVEFISAEELGRCIQTSRAAATVRVSSR